MCLHKILGIIASSAPPPPPATTVSSNQGSSSSARPEVEPERDLSCVTRGIGIDLNMEFSLGGGGEGSEAVSAGSAAEDDYKDPDFSGPPAAVEEEVRGSAESAAIVDQKNSEGEFDPNSNRHGGDCSPPLAEASEATNLRINEIREIGINGIGDEDDDKKEFEEEGRRVQNDSRRADEENRAAETAPWAEGGGGGEKNKRDQGISGISDRRLTVLIEATELASGRGSSSNTLDPDEMRTAAAEETEEESEPHSPSIRGRGGRIAVRGTKRKRRNKCWVVDLYKNSDEMTTETTVATVPTSKRGRRSQVMPSRYRDSSVVMEPWKQLPRRRP
ncbi:unnamed protein product [Linum trigynum]